MASDVIRHPEAAILYGLGTVLVAGARGVRRAAHRLDAWLEARRHSADARAALSEMSDRELRDIGLDRADIREVVKGGSPRAVDLRFCHPSAV